ncbi:MAG TPA: HAD family hydrolase [Candidatus Dormibacteraeota bacterium]|jgi:2-haloalkanoic acid dehalogenase type II|nr:HAD family hydrolase [Candidatus Dormibacteraeota bacterium]
MSADRVYDVITFDCYGTLIDWEGGIAGAFTKAVAETGSRLDPARVLEAYAQIEPAVQAERYRSYRDVLTESARRVARQLGWTLPESRASFLAESLPFWIPFPDTNAALERLFRAGYRLGILSNVDDDLLAGTRKHFTVPFDLLITAQQMHSYKPADGHFLAARDRIAGARWLHAAQSHFHDVVPARRLGVPSAWINRKGEPRAEPRPDREFRTLTELADWLA